MDLGTGFSFSLFHWQKKKKNKRQEYGNTQKKCGEEAQKETIRFRPSLFIRLASIDFPDSGSVGGVKNRNRKEKQRTRNLRKGGLKH